MTWNIAVIGGGITGLSTAYYLTRLAKQQQLDVRCTVYERDRRVGGKIQTHREQGFVMEDGPDSILARKPAGMALIHELGLSSEVVGSPPSGHKTYILKQGRLHPIPPGTNMGIPMKLGPFATTPLLSLGGKARALADLLLPRSSHDGDQSLGRFLRRRLGDDLVDHVVEPLLAGIYAGSVDELSLIATFPQFLELERKYRSLILGSLAQRRKMSSSAETGRSAFVTLRAGLTTIVERLHDELVAHATIHTGTEITAIHPAGDGGYVLRVRDATGEREAPADAIAVTVPAFVASELLAPLVPAAQQLAQIPYVSTATVIVAYPRTALPADIDGAGFVIPRSEGRAITACTWTSNKWPHTAPSEYALIRCYVGRSGQQEGLALADDALVRMVRDELRDILGITATPWFSRVTRWVNAMPQYVVNHKATVASVEQALASHAPGVFLAGAGYRGVGIPDCIADGQNCADKLLAYLQSRSDRR